MGIRHQLRKIIWRTGYDVSGFRVNVHPVARKRALFKAYKVGLVIDVGANTGQYGLTLREDLDYWGPVISFEPMEAAYQQLCQTASGDPSWTTFNCALGDEAGTTEINVAGNSYSSSLLEMLPQHEQSAPESSYIGREDIQVKRLDDVFEEFQPVAGSVYLKIDTQGFEEHVLRGAQASLKAIDTIQLEMSLVPLYDGERLLHETVSDMWDRGYQLVALEPGFSDRSTGQLLQADGIFHRRS